MGIRGELGREDAGVRHLGGHREGDRATPGSEIDPDRGGLRRVQQGVDGVLDDGLGLRTRHEDAGTDGELEVAERRGTGDVLQRLAGSPTGDEDVESRCRLVVDVVSANDRRLHLAAPTAEHVTGEELGVDQRIGDPDVGETLGSRADDGSEGGVGHVFQRRARADVTKPRP